MNQSMGMADFFAMEAGDYLERLDAVVSPPTPPDPREFTRLSRALRGSAIMASQQTIANVAAGLEQLARGLVDERFEWDENTRSLAIRAVDDLKVLVRAASQWGSAEETRAQQIIHELERFGGRSTEPRRAEPATLDAGTRAFIAREGAAVGSALDRAARALALNPRAFESLDSVLRAMQPLRGIASLSDLPPLPDLLSGIERAIGEVKARPDGTPTSGELFDVAARAVSKTAQEIATRGEADTDSAETRQFVELLGERLEPAESPTAEVIDEVEEGPVQLDQLELVSHAEYLKQFAADLEAAQSDTQRALRTHSLAPTLRALSMGAGGPGPLAAGAAHFARAARDAVARGAAVHDPMGLSRALTEAGNTLSSAAQGNEPNPGPRLEAVIAEIKTLGTGTRAPGAGVTRDEPEPQRAVVPPPRAPEFRREASPVVISPPPVPPPPPPEEPEPIEVEEQIPARPVPVAETPDIAPRAAPRVEPVRSEAETAAPTAAENGTDLASSFAELHRIVQERGTTQGTVEEFLGIAADSPAPEPSSQVPDPSEPLHLETAEAEDSSSSRSPLDAIVPLEEDVVPMTPPAISSSAFDEPEEAIEPDLESPLESLRPVPHVPTDIEPTYAADLGGTEESPLDDIVPITQFCYSGTAALQRAISLRDEVRAALAELSDGEHVAELIEEIFDLVQLGIHRPSD